MLKYYKNVVKYNDQVEYGVGIITGWVAPQTVLDHLEEKTKEKVVTCGTLYTKNGINYIIANLFLNPHITELILLEDSAPKKGIAVGIQAFQEFVKQNNLDFDQKFKFTNEHLEEFTTYFQNHIHIVQRKELNQFIQNLKVPNKNWCNITEIEEQEVLLKSQIPSEKVGFQVRANTVYEGWKRAIKLIQTYGYLKTSDYDEQQLELIDLSIVIRNEDLANPSMIGTLNITKKELEDYEETIIDKEKPQGAKYTYGNRFRNQNGIDQLQYMMEELKNKSYSRRAVASLWVPPIDSRMDENPCLDLYQAIIQGEYLHFLAYIRANDVYNGWPRNIYGILKIQEILCNELGYKRGYVNTIAGSAHIYSRDFQSLEQEIQEREISFCEEDERGYFTVSVEANQIRVTFYNRKGETLREFYGTTASELRNQCTFYISNIDHAFYLGQELQKAEIALQENLEYIQDKKLKLAIKN